MPLLGISKEMLFRCGQPRSTICPEACTLPNILESDGPVCLLNDAMVYLYMYIWYKSVRIM